MIILKKNKKFFELINLKLYKITNIQINEILKIFILQPGSMTNEAIVAKISKSFIFLFFTVFLFNLRAPLRRFHVFFESPFAAPNSWA